MVLELLGLSELLEEEISTKRGLEFHSTWYTTFRKNLHDEHRERRSPRTESGSTNGFGSTEVLGLVLSGGLELEVISVLSGVLLRASPRPEMETELEVLSLEGWEVWLFAVEMERELRGELLLVVVVLRGGLCTGLLAFCIDIEAVGAAFNEGESKPMEPNWIGVSVEEKDPNSVDEGSFFELSLTEDDRESLEEGD